MAYYLWQQDAFFPDHTGIVIGISAVVFLVWFGRGHVSNITAIFESMGANAMYVTSVSGNIAGRLTGAAGSLTIEDAEAMANPSRAPSVSIVAPMIQKMTIVSYGIERRQLGVMGVTSDLAKVTLNYTNRMQGLSDEFC